MLGLGSSKVTLFPDTIRLGHPRREGCVNVLRSCEPKAMNVISGRDGIHAEEPRVTANRRQDKMTAQAEPPHRHCHEGHANVKGDTGFFRQNRNGAASFDSPAHRVEQRSDRARLANKVIA
jgi:hypothetical protein